MFSMVISLDASYKCGTMLAPYRRPTLALPPPPYTPPIPKSPLPCCYLVWERCRWRCSALRLWFPRLHLLVRLLLCRFVALFALSHLDKSDRLKCVECRFFELKSIIIQLSFHRIFHQSGSVHAFNCLMSIIKEMSMSVFYCMSNFALWMLSIDK